MRKRTRTRTIEMTARALPDQPPLPRYNVFVDDRWVGELGESEPVALPYGNWSSVRLVPVRR